MAADRGLVASAVLIGLVLGPTLFGIGSGPLNGDAAAYWAQANDGVVADRWTHLGYLGPAALIAPFVDLWITLDLVSWSAAAVGAFAAARIASRDGGDPRLVSVLAAAVLAPWAPFAEVDLPWIAAALLAVAGSPRWMALAVAISPAALLAVPWVAAVRPSRRGELLGAVLLAVLTLTALSEGGWWTGERGVLRSAPLAIGKSAAAFGLHFPWLMVTLIPRERLWRLGWCAPLLLAPADVPTWVLAGVGAATLATAELAVPRPLSPPPAPSALASPLDRPRSTPLRGASSLARGPRWGLPAVAVVVAQLAIAATETTLRVRKVGAESAAVSRAAAVLGPEDGLVAPWTWGARVAVEASGDPYGIRWHPPGTFLRDQRAQWCVTDPPSRALILPSDGVWLDGPAVVAECGGD